MVPQGKLLLILLFLFPSVAFSRIDFDAAFNEPGLTGEATDTLEKKFLDLLHLAKPGSEVLLNLNGLKLPYIAQELIRARDRGVKIGIILRKFKEPEALESLAILKGLGQCTFGSCLKVCGIACSAPAINHNKFYLFSELLDGTRNIVVHTSNNLWESERHNYNDFLVIRNNPELYQAMRRYWLTLYSGRQNPRLPVDVVENIKLHIFPKALIVIGERKIDPVKNVLEKIRCAPGSSVLLAHSMFTDPRIKIARVLSRLKKEDCEVELLIKNDLGLEKIGPLKVMKDSPGPSIISTLGDILHLLPYEEPIDGRAHREGDPKRNSIHSKIILIHAPLGDDPAPRKLVLAGSHNLDVPALKLNNEIMLEIRDDAIYDVYEKSFQRLLRSFLDLSPENRRACPGSGCVL